MKNKLYVVENDCDGFEALYYKDLLIYEGNSLNEGTERLIYFINLANQYGLTVGDIIFGNTELDEFPNRLSEIKNIDWSNDENRSR